MTTSRARNAQQDQADPPSPTAGLDRQLSAGQRSRLLASLRLAAGQLSKAEIERDRRVLAARSAGCSLRDIATAGHFGSHHRVSEILKRAKPSTPKSAS